MNLLRFLFNEEIALAFFLLLRHQLRNQHVELAPEIWVIVGRPANDQRRARFVDQDRVNFVDYRVVQPALDFLAERERHVVAQIIEAELVVLAVGDVGLIRGALFLDALAGNNDADGHAEEAENTPHPFRVAPRQVVIDGHDVHALAAQCVQIRRQCRDQRLTFASAHFGNLAFVQYGAADQLHVEVAHVHDPPASFADNGKGIGLDVVQRFAFRQPLAQNHRLRGEFFVA